VVLAREAKMNFHTKWKFVLFLLFPLSVPFAVQGSWHEEEGFSSRMPSLKIESPKKAPAYVKPINIKLENTEKHDGLINLNLLIKTNPEKHQHVLKGTFSDSTGITMIGTRVRLAGEGKSTVEVVAKSQLGEVFTGNTQIRYSEGVDFSDNNSLIKRLQMNVKGLKGPVGTTRARLLKKGKYTRIANTVIYHPMLPLNDDQKGSLLKKLVIHYRGRLLATFDLGDAISNDPYITFSFIDWESDVGEMQVQWHDTNGKVYVPDKVYVKK